MSTAQVSGGVDKDALLILPAPLRAEIRRTFNAEFDAADNATEYDRKEAAKRIHARQHGRHTPRLPFVGATALVWVGSAIALGPLVVNPWLSSVVTDAFAVWFLAVILALNAGIVAAFGAYYTLRYATYWLGARAHGMTFRAYRRLFK